MDNLFFFLGIIFGAFDIVACIIYFRRRSLHITYLMCLISLCFIVISWLWTIPLFIYGIRNEKRYKKMRELANQMESISIEHLRRICSEKYPAIEGKVSASQSRTEAIAIMQAYALANNIELDPACFSTDYS